MIILSLLLACDPTGTTATPVATAGPGTPAAAPVAVRNTDVRGLQEALTAQKPLLVDVRTPGEYAAGHVPGAVNLPLSDLDRNAPALAGHTDDEIYVICEVGGRSANASSKLAQWGLHPVNVEGGTAAWRAAGLPVE